MKWRKTKKFGGSNTLNLALQGKDKTLQEPITAANRAKNHYTRPGTEVEFSKFYNSCICFLEGKSGEPVLPGHRRAPARIDDRALPHQFSNKYSTTKPATKLKRD